VLENARPQSLGIVVGQQLQERRVVDLKASFVKVVILCIGVLGSESFAAELDRHFAVVGRTFEPSLQGLSASVEMVVAHRKYKPRQRFFFVDNDRFRAHRQVDLNGRPPVEGLKKSRFFNFCQNSMQVSF